MRNSAAPDFCSALRFPPFQARTSFHNTIELPSILQLLSLNAIRAFTFVAQCLTAGLSVSCLIVLLLLESGYTVSLALILPVPYLEMVAARETKIYRQDARSKGTFLSPEQREDLLNPYLPAPPTSRSPAPAPRKRRLQPIQTFLKQQLHLLVFIIMHTLFSVYIRTRQTYHILLDRVFAILYYHHRAPELIRQDVKNLSRRPEHLSVILELKGEERGTASLEALMDEVAEISAWCSCVGIPMLSVYERTGMAHRFEDIWRC